MSLSMLQISSSRLIYRLLFLINLSLFHSDISAVAELRQRQSNLAFIPWIAPVRHTVHSQRCRSKSMPRLHDVQVQHRRSLATKIYMSAPTPFLEEINIKTFFPGAERIIAIGDVHGDLEALRSCLKIASLIDDTGIWVGGATHLVQVWLLSIDILLHFSGEVFSDFCS